MKTRFYLSFFFGLPPARGRVGHAAPETLFIDLPAAQPSPRTAAHHRLSTRPTKGLFGLRAPKPTMFGQPLGGMQTLSLIHI